MNMGFTADFGLPISNRLVSATYDSDRHAGGWWRFSSEVPKPLMKASPRIIFELPVPKEESSCQITKIVFPAESRLFIPRTSLGERLLSIRNQAIATGMELLNEDGVLAEVRRRRGELSNDEADVY